MQGGTEPGWVKDVLEFWFDEMGPDTWFAGGEELDVAIRDRFGGLHEELMRAIPEAAGTDPRVTLATIIVLDQFSRNVHRGTPQAFAGDGVAVDLARRALEAGLDGAMSTDEKKFLYMPFMHSEVLADQERCVDLFKAIGDEASIPFAIEHRDIVARFGRFPHRNRVLGRDTSDDETEFLAHHEGFGQ